MRKSTEQYLTGAILAFSVIALTVSANYLFFSEELSIETSEWIQDGVLQTRTIKLPMAKVQPVRSYGTWASDGV